MRYPVNRMLWTLELALMGLGPVWVVLFSHAGSGVGLLFVWDALALAYILAGWLSLRSQLPASRAGELREMVGPQWYSTLFAVVASSSGLAGGLILVAGDEAGPQNTAAQAAAAATVLLSWLLLHTAFAQIYARVHFADGGLQFPECPVPQFAEFVYFSFTIGTSFAVSDVTVVTAGMRRRVTAHSVLSFFFNAAVVAIAIDWLKA